MGVIVNLLGHIICKTLMEYKKNPIKLTAKDESYKQQLIEKQK